MPKQRQINTPPGEVLPDGAPIDAIKADFAKRLQAEMERKGWNQSELARQASVHMKGGRVGRDSVSPYIRGKTLPGPLHLSGIAKALQVEPKDLIPNINMLSVDAKLPPIEVKDLGEGKAWLRVNKAVPWSVAVKVMQMVADE